MTIRSERTRTRIQQAFTNLLPEKSFASISMTDVAEKAACNPSTVYRHYANTEALLLDCFNQTIEVLKEDVSYPQWEPDTAVATIAYTNLVLFYTHVAQHRHLYQALLNSTRSLAIRRRFRRVVVGMLLQFTKQAGSLDSLSAPADVVCNLLAEMIVGAVGWWLDSGVQYDPALLAEIAVRLSESGLFGLNGQELTESDLSFRPFDMTKFAGNS